MTQSPKPPQINHRQQSILDQPWPRFSDSEMASRRTSLEVVMTQYEISHLLLYGAGGQGTAIPWLTNWSVTQEAACLVSPGERDALFIQYYNHTPLAQRVVTSADVHWGNRSTIHTAIDMLVHRGGRGTSVGVIGPLPFAPFRVLEDTAGRVVDLNSEYAALRLIKSEEEFDWFRIGAALSDLAIDALSWGLRPGLTEYQLIDLIERAYVPWGGKTGIHFLGATSMASPSLCVPAQFPSNRVVQQGDVVITEISASFREYSGQVLRSFTVNCEPTPLYRELHLAAEAGFESIVAIAKPGSTPSDLIRAGQVIEEAGFTICDDLVHGYGGGYFQPVLGLPSRRTESLPDLVLEEGMMIVVQPNVVTHDRMAGVQTGECLRITATGCESLHKTPRGFLRTLTS
ncbi:MAG: hypothetical protein CL396_10315 [Acidiferrobacteraceae bacterium]|nr:hypothetical protein [Acidiferrobacteraceae bacterium]